VNRQKLLAVAVAVVIIGAAGGTALAATSASNTINGCYNSTTGELSVLTPKHKTCAKTEKAISWNQAGIQGKTGPRGPKGASGASTSAYFTGGQFASSLGSPKTVASLTLPSGSFVYDASVNFSNGGGSSDTVTCVLTDGAGKQIDSAVTTVPSAQKQAISLTGASSAPAGPAGVSCSDTANSSSDSVNGAAFTATLTGSVPTAGTVLRTGSVSGPAVAAGDVLNSSFIPTFCTSGSITGTVSADPEGPGSATLSVTSMTVSGCSITIDSSPLAVTVTAESLPYSLTVTDQNGDVSATGAVKWSVSIPALSLTCSYAASSLQGHWDNDINGFTMTNQDLTTANGACPGVLPVSGNVSSVKDTTASGSPLVFVN